MDQKTRDLYTRQKAAELSGQDANLRQLEARAREKNAQDELNEVSGLRALHDRVDDQVRKLRNSADASADQMRADVEQSWNDFKGRLQAAQRKYSAVDDARLDRLDARYDQINARVDALAARAKQDQFGENIAIREAIEKTQAKAAAAREQRKRVRDAKEEARAEYALAYDAAMDDLVGAYDEAWKKVDAVKASGARQSV